MKAKAAVEQSTPWHAAIAMVLYAQLNCRGEVETTDSTLVYSRGNPSINKMSPSIMCNLNQFKRTRSWCEKWEWVWPHFLVPTYVSKTGCCDDFRQWIPIPTLSNHSLYVWKGQDTTICVYWSKHTESWYRKLWSQANIALIHVSKVSDGGCV